MTPSPQSEEAQEREFEAHLLQATWHQVMVQAKDDDDEGASIYRMCRMAAREAWTARASLPSAAASGEASVQEAEAPNFCARCGKRLGAGIHTCTPPSAQEAEPKLPTYGTLPWATVRAYVTAAAGAPPIIDADYDIGHQVVGINFNSLNRIMSALAASQVDGLTDDQIKGQPLFMRGYDAGMADAKRSHEAHYDGPVPMASSAGEPVAYLLTSKSGMTKWTLTASEVDDDVREAFLADGVGIQPLGHLAPPTASLREQEWESLYRRMKNCAGGYSNLCEEDRPAARQLEKEYAQIDQEARNLIDAQRLGRGKESGNG